MLLDRGKKKKGGVLGRNGNLYYFCFSRSALIPGLTEAEGRRKIAQTIRLS